MRKTFVILIIICTLLLSGCASMFDAKYEYEEKHINSANDNSDNEIKAESYDELVDVIYDFVISGVKSVSFKYYSIDEKVNETVAKAIQQVKLNTPEGTYAVDLISSEITHIVSYYEIDLTISYLKSRTQMDAIEYVGSQFKLEKVLTETLSEGQNICIIRIQREEFDEENILNTIRECYYDNPANAIIYPNINIDFYPNDGEDRIAEIQLTYSVVDSYMERLKNSVSSNAQEFISTQRLYGTTADNANQICASLNNYAYYVEAQSNQYGSGIYGVFGLKNADSEGFALAYKYVCDNQNIDSIIVEGTYNGEPHFWNIVKIDNSYYHIDSSLNRYLSDDSSMINEYHWDTEKYPQCDKIYVGE